MLKEMELHRQCIGWFSLYIMAFYILIWFFFPFFEDDITKKSLTTNSQKEALKEYLEKRGGFKIPEEFQPLEIGDRNGKDKLRIVGGEFEGEITNLMDLLTSDYDQSPDTKHTTYLKELKPIEEDSYKFSKKSDGYMEIIIVPTNELDKYDIYFHFFDKNFPYEKVFQK